MKHNIAKLPAIVSLFVALSIPASAQEAADPYKKAPTEAVTSRTSAYAPIVSLHLDTFSLPIRDAFALLREFPTDDARFNQLIKLVDQGKAKIERMTVLRAKSGNRTVLESIHELRYPTQFDTKEGVRTVPHADPLKAGNTGSNVVAYTVFPVTFETRNVGETFEVEPMVNADNTIIDINLVPQKVQYMGDREQAGAPGFPQPLFQTQKVTMSVTIRAGTPFLLATPSAPFETGLNEKEAEQRVSLQFLTANVVNASGEPVSANSGAITPAGR